MRILIAEDDQVLADGLLRTLRASGAVVDHVASGSEADAALLTNNEFDLLILDLGLPKMHGLEVLKKLRGRGSALPVLILTAADSSTILPSMVATRPAWSYTSGPCLMALLAPPMPRRVRARTRASSSCRLKGLAM